MGAIAHSPRSCGGPKRREEYRLHDRPGELRPRAIAGTAYWLDNNGGDGHLWHLACAGGTGGDQPVVGARADRGLCGAGLGGDVEARRKDTCSSAVLRDADHELTDGGS